MWYTAQAAELMGGREAGLVLRHAIAHAHRRVWATQFVVDVRPQVDRSGSVLTFLRTLAHAAQRGVDVRVLLPILPAPDGTPYDINLPAASYLGARGIRVYRYVPKGRRAHMHAKFLVIDDDLCMCSNQNWTYGAFSWNGEDVLGIRSGEATDTLAAIFRRLVRDGLEIPTRDMAARSGTLPLLLPAAQTRVEGLTSLNARAKIVAVDRYGRLLGGIRDEGRLQLVAGQRYVKTVCQAFATAQQRIWMAMAVLRASTTARLQPLIGSLLAAKERGIDVRVMYETREGPHSDWTADVGRIADAGVPVQSWSGRGHLHRRSILIDERTVVTGSVGWSPQSIYLSEELSVLLEHRDTASRMAAQFEREWTSRQVRPGFRQAVPAVGRCAMLVGAQHTRNNCGCDCGEKRGSQ